MATENFDEQINSSVFSIFEDTQETLAEAQKRNSAENNVRIGYFRLSKDGTYAVRILPLAPNMTPDGQVLPMDRKGYEYPTKEFVLKIKGTDDKGKEKITYVSVCHTRLAFPEVKEDLIDLYARRAAELNAGDEDFCKKIRESGFNGGLKYDSRRNMYILDLNERDKGIQILALSYAQYKELEERKLALWSKLISRNPKSPCPISSPSKAYPVEITRKSGAKTEYKVNIDTISGEMPLEEKELKALLEAPRLPEILYSYKRFHLEATIEFLRQLDTQFGLNIMDEQETKDCIDQIKLQLPSDDTTHFSLGKGSQEQSSGAVTIDSLWDEFEANEKKGVDDRSEEGQAFRGKLREFIEANNLDVRIERRKSNETILNEISDAMNGENPKKEEEPEADAPVAVEDFDDDNEDFDDEIDERNDDTSEPAARPRVRPRRNR